MCWSWKSHIITNFANPVEALKIISFSNSFQKKAIFLVQQKGGIQKENPNAVRKEASTERAENIKKRLIEKTGTRRVVIQGSHRNLVKETEHFQIMKY